MLGVSNAVEVLVLGPLVVYKIPYSSCIFNTAIVVACVIFTHGFSRCCCGYWIWVFSCLFVVYIYVVCSAGYAEPPVLLYLLQCLVPWYITCRKREEALDIYIVIGEVLVLGLVVVVYKIPYSSCMWVRQNVFGVFPSYYCLPGIWYNACACHGPLYHYITATVVYLVQPIIAACVVVIWSQILHLSRMNSQCGRWVCWKSSK